MILNLGNTLLMLFIFFHGGNSDPAKKAKRIQARLEWDQKTLTKVSSSDKGERFCGYARLMQLADNGLICVYGSDGSIVNVKSSDGVHMVFACDYSTQKVSNQHGGS